MSVTYGGDKITFDDGSSIASGYTNFRNRIINGDMQIDQRNAGSANTPSNTNYTLDRWQCFLSGGGAYTVLQSNTAPTGFVNSLLVTTTTADSSIAAGDYYIITHKIEGTNISDLAWGSASAKTVTLSFWVRSSLTGTFSGALNNSDGNRSYPFSYTISSGNTWEYKTITIAGDTTGTWLTTTGRGIILRLSLGMGSTYSGTANAWAASDFYASSNETAKVIGTLNATWQITGVQLEVGSFASTFERRPYGTELQLCQRYYQTTTAYYESPVTSGQDYAAVAYGATSMRATPTATGTSTSNFNFPSSAGALVVFDTRTVHDRRRANGTGAGNFATTITLNIEL
jgi:hypothetical protein